MVFLGTKSIRKIKLFSIVFASLCVFALCACTSDESLLMGKWRGKLLVGSGDFYMAFNSDGSYIESTDKGIKNQGTWSLSKSTITINDKDGVVLTYTIEELKKDKLVLVSPIFNIKIQVEKVEDGNTSASNNIPIIPIIGAIIAIALLAIIFLYFSKKNKKIPHSVVSSDKTLCGSCGKELDDGAIICPNCGNPIVNHVESTKNGFKKYLPYILGAVVVLAIIGYFSSKDSKGGSDTQTVVVDSLAERNSEIEESKPSTNPFVGKVYKGGGNGGGLAINMRITFVDDKECLCVSDWYQAYSTEKQIRCAYDVKGNHVIIHVNDDGTKYDLDFDVKEDGRIISFDKSDPSAGGSMGNDYMSLEIVDGNATDGTDEGRFAAEDEGANETYSSSSNTSSSSRTFYSEQIVIGYLANQSFRSNDGLTMRVDGDGRLYVDGQYAGVLSVLRYNSTSALLRYGGGMYGEGKLTVQIVGDKFQLKDPTDGTVYYQR